MPDASAVKTPGLAVAMGTVSAFDRAPRYSTCTCVLARPATPYGTTVLIWSPATYSSGAGTPSNRTRTPASLVATLPDSSCKPTPSDGPIPEPKMLTTPPGATGPVA